MEEGLAELRAVHAELRDLLQAIEAETDKPKPDMAALSAVRLQLTRASRRRASLIDALIGYLRPGASEDLIAQLEKLRTDIQQGRFASASHIGEWTILSIESDWSGYRVASQAVRARMRIQIEREAALLQSLGG